jgi:hypothetical protein
MADIWDNKHAKQQKRAADIMRGNTGGKGDKRRPTNESAFSLGMKLVKIADTKGKDSKEYKDTERAWREAVRKGR